MNDLEVLARTIYGEARGEDWLGRVAVGWVIKNRARKGGWWGNSIQVCALYPWQFSCWNENDPNRAKILAATVEDEDFVGCLAAAAAVLEGLVDDPTGGACHYHAEWVKPDWAEGEEPDVTIGRHHFYRDIA